MKTFKQYKVNEKSLAGSVAGKAKGQIIPFHTLFNTPDGWESEFVYTNVKGDRKKGASLRDWFEKENWVQVGDPSKKCGEA